MACLGGDGFSLPSEPGTQKRLATAKWSPVVRQSAREKTPTKTSQKAGHLPGPSTRFQWGEGRHDSTRHDGTMRRLQGQDQDQNGRRGSCARKGVTSDQRRASVRWSVAEYCSFRLSCHRTLGDLDKGLCCQAPPFPALHLHQMRKKLRPGHLSLLRHGTSSPVHWLPSRP